MVYPFKWKYEPAVIFASGTYLLAGSIPSELGMCSELVEINLCWNSLWGTIPETLSLLASLNSSNLSQNQITGSIPEALQLLEAE